MSTITLPNIRVSSDLTVELKLKDGGVAIDWSTLSNIRVCIYSDVQHALAGRCTVAIDETDSTVLVCQYAANKPQYLGVNRVIVQASYMGETKTYDKPALNFVRWTEDQEGEEITITDPDIDVEIEVEDVSSSILQEAIDAALNAAADAEHAAHLIPNQVLLDCEQATADANEAAATANAAGIDQVTATVDANVGTPSVDVSLADKHLTLGFHNMKGVTGDAAGFGTVGATVDANVGTPAVSVSTSGPDTAKNISFAFSNLKGEKGDKGDQGNTGSSVDYPYELVNNLTTNDSTKGLSAAMGVQLEGEVSQLDLKVGENNGLNRIPVNIPGNNNTLVPMFVYGLLSGKKYRVKILNPSVPVSNIPASMSIRFNLSYKFVGSGTYIPLVDIKCNSLSTPLADYYDITIPDTNDLDCLLFQIRCNSGSTLQMYINEDTSGYATKTEIEEVAGKYESHPEWIYVILDSDKRILGGFREDGSIDWVLGVPQPIKDYIAEQLQGVESKVNSPEWMQVITDNDGNVLYGVKENGSFDWAMGIPLPIKNEFTKIYDILKADEDGLPVLPDYYFEDGYLDNKILAINDEIRKCAINGDIFFWITDIHWDHYNQRLSPSIIKYIREKTGIIRLLCGGDVSDGHDGLDQHYIWHDSECMLDFFGKTRAAIGSNRVYATYGNHDFYGENDYDSVFYEYGMFRENVVYADEYKTAYYVDNEPQKMRYIALGEWGLYNGVYEDLLTASVKTWFANVALDVPAGWTIVIIIHGLFSNIQGTNTLIPYIDQNTGTWAVNSGTGKIIQPIEGCTDIIDTIDNYKANGGLGDIACVLMGHWHCDRIHIGRVVSPATTGVPYILTQSDQFHDSFVGGISDIKAPRTLGTITEQHFEVVVINKDDRTVKLFAIGSLARDGIDNNVGNLVEVRTVNY